MPNPQTQHISDNKTSKIKYFLGLKESPIITSTTYNKKIINYRSSFKINSSSGSYHYKKGDGRMLHQQFFNQDNQKNIYYKNSSVLLNYSNTKGYCTTNGENNKEKAGDDSKKIIQNRESFYSQEILQLDELKNLASLEIASGSADGFVLADLLGKAIVIAENILKQIDFHDILFEAIEEAKIVLDAIYDGTIDDFIIPENLHQDAPVFSGEFDDLKNAIFTAIHINKTL